MYFEYGEKELIYLKQKDKRLAEVIDQVGMIDQRIIYRLIMWIQLTSVIK